MPVNPTIRKPRRPGPWVDEVFCERCGALYDEFRGGPTFAEATALVRSLAEQEGDEGGGYKSRGPVLWAMRAGKLRAWYAEHRHEEEDDDGVPF